MFVGYLQDVIDRPRLLAIFENLTEQNKVLKNTEDCEIESWNSLAHEEEAKAAGPCVG
ncbi:hypothetical protein HanHA300_Chr04g0133571 [Helianthus annuus]|nr:hypothetical protein HanHA300_Chr04g0133571 [Helianthus annuus]KAJ0596748.1 hypothetical protein HanHA89_Chr04g0146491 [Helianthus annuus]KAJ0757425.1 hypothetical protein HanLR1_Chr04g0138591 [Helianthus annuus]